MKSSLCIALAALVLTASSEPPSASGVLGVYAIVERVVFEPNESAPVRLRVHGAFAFVNGGVSRPLGVSQARRGVVRFSMPVAPGGGSTEVAAIKREWADLKAVAGTGQAVGFGSWRYFGLFTEFTPDGRGRNAPQALIAGNNSFGEFRVSAIADSLAAQAVLYVTDAGVVKLTEASHSSVISQLRAALRQTPPE